MNACVSAGELFLVSSMRMTDLFRTSTDSVTRNKSRSFLTILGIVIGIGAVILMLAIGQGAEGYILNQVADLGSDLVFVEPSSGNPAAGPPDPFIEQSVNLDDADAMKESGLFSVVSPILISTMTVSHEEQAEFSQIVGVDPGYIEIFPANIEFGRSLDQEDVDAYAKVAVLGKEIAETLFGDQNPVGKKMKIKGVSFRVIGKFNKQGTRFFQNLDERIAIPVTTMQRDVMGVDHVTFIASRAIGDVEYAKEETRFLLRDTHDIDNPEGIQEKDNFFVSSQEDAVEIVGAIGAVLTVLLSSIAAISLLVGGIGIMNIMLVSVNERIKEIGLRKAVGATEREILLQFLIEAVLLTLLGGLVGVIGGVFVTWVAGIVLANVVEGWSMSVPMGGIVLAVLVSSIVGVVFGVFPAKKAAKLNPIAALRYE